MRIDSYDSDMFLPEICTKCGKTFLSLVPLLWCVDHSNLMEIQKKEMRMNNLFSITIEDFHMIPAVRMTGKSIYGSRTRKRTMAYLDNKRALAWLFKQAHKGETITTPCILSFAVHLPHRRIVDVDNIQKTIQDALQDAQVVSNDHLIKGTDKTRLYQKAKGPARVEVTLVNYWD